MTMRVHLNAPETSAEITSHSATFDIMAENEVEGSSMNGGLSIHCEDIEDNKVLITIDMSEPGACIMTTVATFTIEPYRLQ